MAFIFQILLSWGCMSKFNLTQWLLISWWRNLKSSLQLKARLIFEFLVRKILGTVKHVQLHEDNFRHVPYSVISSKLSTALQTHFNSSCKEEHLKGNRDWSLFCAHFTMDRDSHHQFDAATLLKIIWIKITFFKWRVSIILWSFSS